MGRFFFFIIIIWLGNLLITTIQLRFLLQIFSCHSILSSLYVYTLQGCDFEKIYCLRVLKRLGFTPPFVRRARYFRTNLSEDCYSPSRVLQDWKKERYFHSYSLDYHSEVSGTRFISTWIYSHVSMSKTLIFKIRFISTVYNRQSKSLNWTFDYQTQYYKVVREGEQFSRKHESLGKYIDKHIFYSNRSWLY
jgi:hypothetical protein